MENKIELSENKGNTYTCIVCGEEFTLTIQWMIDEIEIKGYAKICTKCHNEMMREAVYGNKKCNCLNCILI